MKLTIGFLLFSFLPISVIFSGAKSVSLWKEAQMSLVKFQCFSYNKLQPKKKMTDGNKEPIDILLVGDSKLRLKSVPVSINELLDPQHSIHREMLYLQQKLELFRLKHGFGRGISAPQIGINKRMIAFHCSGLNNDQAFVMLNPEIIEKSEDRLFSVFDDCMSLPDLLVRVYRYEYITVKYQMWDEKLKRLIACAVSLQTKETRDMSELLQHEIDHLDGVLMTDRAIDKNSIIHRNVFLAHPEWFRDQVDLFYDF